MFGCYRRGDANDPDTYVMAVTAVLMRYSPEVVRTVTDPYSGLPSRKSESGWSGLPDVADVKQACEAEAARQERINRYRAIGPTLRRLPAPARGVQATIFTPEGYRHYDRLVRRKTAEPDSPAYFESRECHDKVVRYGIWTPFSWVDDPTPGVTGFTMFTDEQLRAMYPPPEQNASRETSAEPAE